MLHLNHAVSQPPEKPQPRQPPRDFTTYRGHHQGETILVCGCGCSLRDLVAPERFTTIGVNDVGRLFTPDYLVVLNPRSQFSDDRFRYVEESQAKALFTQLDLGISHPNLVRFRLGRRGDADLSDAVSLPYTSNSPYVALCLALHMGAKRIGLIGVDFTDHHFFGPTGSHPLSERLKQIDDEYKALARTCARLGVEVYNLGATSRLTAFPKISPAEFARLSLEPAGGAVPRPTKIFFVNYRFLSCGDVFSDGLRHAAQDLGVQSESAYWDDSDLPAKVDRFAPDMLLVVHGRNYSKRWKSSLHPRSAVWLLDEPYEVDDTSVFSQRFSTVFVNDPSTLHRHRNAHFLPVCYDPSSYHCRPGAKDYRVGFIGGCNPARERMLGELARRGLLSYVVGGPWRDGDVRRLCLSENIPASETADLYRQTQIVVNVFRTSHQYNREGIQAVSMNPRIYEALACGAVVISERRPEIERMCPEMPLFEGADQLGAIIENLLCDPSRLSSIRDACMQRLASHTYAQRLQTVMAATLGSAEPRHRTASAAAEKPAISLPALNPLEASVSSASAIAPEGDVLSAWEWEARCVRKENGFVVLRKQGRAAPGGEAGMVGKEKYADVRMSFEVLVEPGSIFLAKIHLAEQRNHKSNSYHLVMNGRSAYLARQNAILQRMPIRNGAWEAVAISYQQGRITVEINGNVQSVLQDSVLSSGYCFLGVQAGAARVRELVVTAPITEGLATLPAASIIPPVAASSAAVPASQHPGVLPFSNAPVRNLIYHIWPVRGSMWRWNLDQLKARIDLFNGRRLIGVVHDKRSESPDAVEAYLQGHGCEFLVAANQPGGEVATFPAMLRRVASKYCNEVTFYGHAKGVKYEPSIPNAVRRWADVSYRASLDDWRAVRADLERFALTGSFRMFGRFRAHRNTGDWHYSGTYYWMRHARVFAKDCLAVPPFYCGVEAWPGKYFGRHEAGCLLFDDVRQLAYDERFWQSKEPDVARWEAERTPMEPPPDWDVQRSFEGHLWPHLDQRPDEIAWLLKKLADISASTILVIGAMQAGLAWHIARRFRNLGRDIKITAAASDPTVRECLEDARRRFEQAIDFIEGDAAAADIRAQLSASYDAVLVGGDRSYRGARSAFDFALSLHPRAIGLHDIVDSHWHAHSRCCVSRLWAEVCGRYPSESRTTGDWGGIGIVHTGG